MITARNYLLQCWPFHSIFYLSTQKPKIFNSLKIFYISSSHSSSFIHLLLFLLCLSCLYRSVRPTGRPSLPYLQDLQVYQQTRIMYASLHFTLKLPFITYNDLTTSNTNTRRYTQRLDLLSSFYNNHHHRPVILHG